MVCVSVVLPTYNRRRSLGAAIASVLQQSWRDLELIVVDDGSAEDIESLVREIDDPRLKFFRRAANGGAAAARNTGLSQSTGRFVAFQDSDDVWLPGRLERQVNMLSDLPPSIGAVVGHKILYGRGTNFSYGPGQVCVAPDPKGLMTLQEDQVAHLLRENRVSVQNSLFRRECYPGHEWFDPCAKANEDWDFAVRLAQVCRIKEHPDPVVLAFVSDDSISRQRFRQTLGLVRIIKKNRGLLPRYRKEFASMYFDLGRALWAEKKRRSGLRFMTAGVMAHPRIVYSVVAARVRRAVPIRVAGLHDASRI